MTFLDIIPESDLAAYKSGVYGRRMGFGKKPAILIIDMLNAFVKQEFPLNSGELGRNATTAISELLKQARSKSTPIPIVYTTIYRHSPNNPAHATSRKRMLDLNMPPSAYEIVEELRPSQTDYIIAKGKASAFFGTPLISILNYNNIDTLIITGTTTSGCVRATVVDGASYNYWVIVPEECTADRAIFPHKVNLFDIDMKYGDVVLLSEAIKYIDSL